MLAAPIAATLDVEQLLWVPKPIIVVPAMPVSHYGIYNSMERLAHFTTKDSLVRLGQLVNIQLGGDVAFIGVVSGIQSTKNGFIVDAVAKGTFEHAHEEAFQFQVDKSVTITQSLARGSLDAGDNVPLFLGAHEPRRTIIR